MNTRREPLCAFFMHESMSVYMGILSSTWLAEKDGSKWTLKRLTKHTSAGGTFTNYIRQPILIHRQKPHNSVYPLPWQSSAPEYLTTKVKKNTGQRNSGGLSSMGGRTDEAYTCMERDACLHGWFWVRCCSS
jgi:hypothetical protein